MDREIVWTLRATADLESIVEYIFRDSEFYATAVARELIAAARSPTVFAERGRMVPSMRPRLCEINVRRTQTDLSLEARAHRSLEDHSWRSKDASDSISRLTIGLSRIVSVLASARNRPIAAVVPLKNVDRESLALSSHPEFLKIIAKSRRQFVAGKTMSLEEMKKAVLPRRAANKRIERTRKARPLILALGIEFQRVGR